MPLSDPYLRGNLELRFGKFRLCPDEIKHTIEECKERDATYSAPLKVEVRLHNKETDTIKEHEIYIGERTSWLTITRSAPLITKEPVSVINGRSPI